MSVPGPLAMDAQLRAFFDVIAISELGSELIAVSDNGYNVLVGSTPAHPRLFQSYADHPRIAVEVQPGLVSTAAGRYQILARYFDAYKGPLGLTDFGPAAQDTIALQMIRECRAVAVAQAGQFDEAVFLCRAHWASLPGAGYAQHENKLADLRNAFIAAGGQLA